MCDNVWCLLRHSKVILVDNLCLGWQQDWLAVGVGLWQIWDWLQVADLARQDEWEHRSALYQFLVVSVSSSLFTGVFWCYVDDLWNCDAGVVIPGSWFIPRQRCIGRHDSSSSSCPPQPLQPRPSWGTFSWDLSWRHLSSSVACWPGLLLKPSGSHVRACRGSLWWSIRERCPSHFRCLHLIMSSSCGSAVASPSNIFNRFSDSAKVIGVVIQIKSYFFNSGSHMAGLVTCWRKVHNCVKYKI